MLHASSDEVGRFGMGIGVARLPLSPRRPLRWMLVSIILGSTSVATLSPSEAAEPSGHSAIGIGLTDDRRVLLTLGPQAFDQAFLLSQHPPSRIGIPPKYLTWRMKDRSVAMLLPDPVTATGIRMPIDGIVRSEYGMAERHPAVYRAWQIVERVDDGSVRIDVTDLFLADTAVSRGRAIRSDLSYIDSVGQFGDTVVVKGLITVAPSDDTRGNPTTYERRWSLTTLPDRPMPVRLYTPGMAYGALGSLAGTPMSVEPMPIVRLRLEKRNPGQAVSEPVQPIVFYLDPSIPEMLRPWFRRGIEVWNQAFEAAGFAQAIEVRDPPADVDWDLFSVAHSTLLFEDRSQVFGEFGRAGAHAGGGGGAKALIDPRSGEILRANILVALPYGHGMTNYFSRCAALDPRAQSLDFPVDLQKELAHQLIGHETGHAFGLMDANYGEASAFVEELRDRDWLHEHGYAALMGYGRCNYVAQPEDGVRPQDLLPRLNAADVHQIKLGYMPSQTPHDPYSDLQFVQALASEQNTSPRIRFAPGWRMSLGPQFHNETSEAIDPVHATRLGQRNLDRNLRILEKIAAADTVPEELLKHQYNEILQLWLHQMDHVLSMVGGVMVSLNPLGAPGSAYAYAPVPAHRQREAMRYIADTGFAAPNWLESPIIARRLDPRGVLSRRGGYFTVGRVSSQQAQLLREVLHPDRLVRVLEFETTGGGDAYTLWELISDVHKGITSELSQRRVSVGIYRQALQLEYARRLASAVRPDMGNSRVRYGDYERALLTSKAEQLLTEVDEALSKTKETATRGHLIQMRNLLRAALKVE